MNATTITTEDILASVAQLPDATKREIAIKLLQQFTSQTILELLRRIEPADAEGPDYEDPGPLTDEESIYAAEQAFLEYDRQEAANAQPSAG